MRTIITVVGKDTVGIIANVSAVCAKYSVNIIDITQSVMEDMFNMVMLTDISNISCSFTQFSDELKNYGKENNLSVHVMHEDIFNSMHRI